MKSELERVCEDRGLRASCKYHGRAQWSGQAMMEWRVTLYYQGRRMTTKFFQGMGHTEKPTAPDVISCLISDTRFGELSFEECCEELGDDPDSRKAYTTWKACVRAAPRVRKLLGEAFNTFADAEH